ncbi:MAG: formate--tetrahydrofolate ligase [Myxococcota bacterium]
MPNLQSIQAIAEAAGLGPADIEPHGHYIAKLAQPVVDRASAEQKGKLVLVSAMTPTPAGEGKTTTSIGLAQGLKRKGKSSMLALREPSLGPCMGMKGGATGGGASSIHPEDRINLHFTGDLHAITSAHNLLAAMLDNHLHFDNPRGIRQANWKRVLDMNDRALRNVVVGLGGTKNGFTRETSFDITAASEVMAMLCLAENREDLEQRIDRTWIGFDNEGRAVTPKDINATTGMLVLLKDALLPNLVQTTEGVPALIHGGPFANIAHGCNSVIATKTALGLADWVVTEAGFAFDLGGEKFFDIKCRSAGLDVAAVVLVGTIRALKMHGGVALDQLSKPNSEAVAKGIGNIEKHIDSIRAFGKEPILALNKFPTDSQAEVDVVAELCRRLNIRMSEASHFADGGAGADDLAQAVLDTSESKPLQYLYEDDASVSTKIESIARRIYGARSVLFTTQAQKQLARVEQLGLTHLPVCMAKTQKSLSDDPSKLGRPTDFDITVRDVEISTGAGFLVILTGDMMRMPGLPRVPRSEKLRLEGDSIHGLMG